MFGLENMNLTDIICSSSLFVVFLVTAVFSGRKTWITTDIIFSVGFGLTFILFPSALMEFQVAEKLDFMHLFLARLYGVTMLCSGLTWYLTKETRDGTVPITLMMSRVFSCSITLIAQIYSHSNPKSAKYWKEQHVYFGIVGMSLWLLGNLVQLVRSNDFSTYPQHNIRLNNNLRVDSLFMMLMAFVMVAFPSSIIKHLFEKTPNGLHLHMLHCIGALGFGDAVVSLQAPGFLHERDKRAQLCSRVLWVLLLFVPWIISALFTKATSLVSLSHVALFYLAPFINATMGYFTEGNVIYKVPNRKETKLS